MGMKNKGIVWKEVSAAGSSTMLPAGGYVAIIKDVEDNENSEYLEFTYDIAEGDKKDFFASDTRKYTHQFRRYYTEKSLPYMAHFLECVEDSNSGFSLDEWDSDPNDLKGKLVGIIVQREDYTNQAGEDRARMNVEWFAKADDIRNGRYKLPDPKDTRKKNEKDAESTEDSGSVYDADIPF